MDARTRIPVIALMGLSLTECKAEDDPIVGDWSVVELDGDAFPMVYTEGPYSSRTGIDMQIAADLEGELSMYQVYDYGEDLKIRSQYTLYLSVDVDAAPTYRIDVRVPDQKLVIGEDSEYEGEGGYASGADTAETGAATDSGAPLEPPQGRERLAPRGSSRAATVLTLTCQLADDELDCESSLPEDEGPQSWRFVRAVEKN